MSRTLLTAAALAAFALPGATAEAQLGFGLAAGVSEPMGDFGKTTDAGYHLTGLMTVSAPLAPVGLRIEGTFSEFNYKGTLAGAKARLLYGTANAVVSTGGIMSPYLIGGVGIYNSSAQCTGCTTSATKVGFNGGAGFKVGLSGFSVFGEARYHYIAGANDPTNGGVNSSTQFIPISVGVTF